MTKNAVPLYKNIATMKRICAFLTLAVTVIVCINAANDIQLKNILDGTYSTRSLGNITPLSDGEHYAQKQGNTILRYSFRTGEIVDTLFSTSNCRGCTFDRFDGYILSPQEDRILIQTKTQSIYRRSFTAEYYIYSVTNKKMSPLSDGGPQQVPAFSPDGKMIAFVRDNNIFIVKLMYNNAEVQVTTDGKRNEVLNGHADWVYEEEFSMNRAYEFSADSKMLAFVKSIEKEVPEYSFPMFKGSNPTFGEYATYPGAYTYKYPVPGVKNSTVTVHSFDIKSSVTRQINVPLDEDGYIPRIHFTEEADAEGNQNQLAVITLNRAQTRMDLYLCNARSTVSRLALREEANRGWIDENTYESIAWLPTGFVLQSERTGYNHLYLYDQTGRLVRPLTAGEWEVTAFCGYDEKTGDVFYQGNAPGPLYKVLYRKDKKGKTTPLSTETGTHSAIFSKNLKYFIHTASALDMPPVTTLENAEGKTLKTLVDNSALKEKLIGPGMPTREFFSFTTDDGVKLDGWMVKPANMAAGKEYPVVMYQYSGPGSQEVSDNWGSGFYGGLVWEEYLAQQGIIAVCVDGRGTGYRGEEWKKCTYLKIGTLEARDQAETARYLGSLPYVNKDRIAIWGWSYGGYMTLMSLSEAPVFCCGIAVAPPTDWRFYDSVYTERFMLTPQENGNGYDAASAIVRADKLNGRLLLVHGMADDNVHFRNSAEYSEALVQADKQFEMQIYTNRNHSIYGGNTRAHLFTRMAEFWKRELLD